MKTKVLKEYRMIIKMAEKFNIENYFMCKFWAVLRAVPIIMWRV